MRASVLCLAILIAANLQAQTKKIANASTHSFGPSFNWNSSDNLGEIMDYEEMMKYQFQYDSINNVNMSIDTCTKLDTVVADSLVTVYEKESACDTIKAADSTKGFRVKFQQGDGKEKKKKTNSKKTKGLQEEVRTSKKEYIQEDNQLGGKGLFMLLLIPIGFLMVKKK